MAEVIQRVEDSLAVIQQQRKNSTQDATHLSYSVPYG